MSAVLSGTEERYTRTFTEPEYNRIVRRWRDGSSGVDEYLFSGTGRGGSWYTVVKIGNPLQELEVDIDMLSPDFYMTMTTNGRGSKFDTFGSSTFESGDEYAHPLCRRSSEMFQLPHSSSQSSQMKLKVPICQPGKYSLHTLTNSGAILGLSPLGQSSSLSRISSPSVLEQLRDLNLITSDIFSLTLLDSQSGILSLGGSIAAAVEETKIRAEKELAYLARLDVDGERTKMQDEIKGAVAFAIPTDSTHEHHFKWTDVGSGAVAGWHMTLATGIWVNGIKVLRNQPVLFDINCPILLAPPIAARTIYDSISGARSLASMFDDDPLNKENTQSFYAFPCLNEMDLEFEIAGWRFPFGKSQVREDAIHGPTGGRFSLGQLDLSADAQDNDKTGTGYCVGIVVGSGMDTRTESSDSTMRNVWVLGEPFFRGLGVAFDMGSKTDKSRVGLRVY